MDSNNGLDGPPPDDMGNTTTTNNNNEQNVPVMRKTNNRQQQQYSSVARQESSSIHDVESDEDELLDDDDDEQGGHHHHVRRPPKSRRRHPDGFGAVRIFQCGMFIMLLLVGAGLGVYYYLPGSRNGGAGKTKNPDNDKASGGEVEPSSTTKKSSSNKNKYPVTYDPSVGSMDWNPLDLQPDDFSLLGLLSPPMMSEDDGDDDTVILGYTMQPDIVNNTVVFVSDGDLYWSRLPSSKQQQQNKVSAAIRLTYTVGNVRHPKIHPNYPYLIAFLATYQARRDVYLIDLRRHGTNGGGGGGGNRPVQRLTYFDSSYGVSTIAGWKRSNGNLVFGAANNQVGLQDPRLYEMSLIQKQQSEEENMESNKKKKRLQQQQWSVLEIRPVPLAQATEGVFYDDNDQKDNCLIFVRYKQGSWTARYVGGTAESLWGYCDGQPNAVHVTSDYHGTSRLPQVWTNIGGNRKSYVLFMSDRSPVDKDDTDVGPPVFISPHSKWRATTMNLWAAPLPTQADMYNSDDFVLENAIQLTEISCQFDGMALREYTIDPVTGNAVLRVGADLYLLSTDDIRSHLENPNNNAKSILPIPLPIHVVSDYHEQQERLISVSAVNDMHSADVFSTNFDSTAFMMTLRGQLWVSPVVEDTEQVTRYEGAGQNLPDRRYRVVPGSMMGGSIRVLAARYVPWYLSDADDDSSAVEKRRLSLVLATDPLSETAEHAFYLLEVQADAVNQFVNFEHLPTPFLGGHVNGGSTQDGGLGSVRAESVVVSPCGRRFAWTDTDDRICIMTMPMFTKADGSNDEASPGYKCLPKSNDMNEPLTGSLSTLSFSPGGRYLAVNHNALNHFEIVSIVDCGNPEATADGRVADVFIGQISQVTPSRFNSNGVYWGRSTFDIFLHQTMSSVYEKLGLTPPDNFATALFFITDRDIMSDVRSPWGSRAPLPHFTGESNIYALPLVTLGDQQMEEARSLMGRFSGGGAREVFAGALDTYKEGVVEAGANDTKSDTSVDGDENRRYLKRYLREKTSDSLQGRRLNEHEEYSLVRYLQDSSLDGDDDKSASATFPKDAELQLPHGDLSFARKAYRMAHIPRGKYTTILSQTEDDGSLVLIGDDDSGYSLKFYAAEPFPSDWVDETVVSGIQNCGLSTSRKHFFVVGATGSVFVVTNTASGVAAFARDTDWKTNQVDVKQMAVSVWPALEYRQIYGDAWRLLRDYFYDPNLHNVDWAAVHDRYQGLVQRCGKREELDDVLGMMGSELSALHLFVYGGEYNSPDSPPLDPASLGATLKRAPEWKGYMVVEIPERDPDFNLMDSEAVYCPISDQALRPSGQMGLRVGDVIVAVNGESVMNSDLYMMLRGMEGRSVRLEVLRLKSRPQTNEAESVIPEPLIVVPISPGEAGSLRYGAWEWRTRQSAKELAEQAGFTVGYMHLRAMNRDGEDAFARGFFPDFDKDALILDVRHNNGGNIDSWLVSFLQRKAWSYWAGRGHERFGDMDWNEHYAFRGKLVVLIDEHTSSDGEGVSRGISELGIGKLIGVRTWGGGIWGASENKLADGGIAAAPEWGVFTEELGWGAGVEMTGVDPDIVVDNDPRMVFDGKDQQLERAISELKKWLEEEPVVGYAPPASRPDMSLHSEVCPT